MKRLILSLCLLLGLSFAQESFEDFLREELGGYKQEQRDFEAYLREVNREFEEYKRIVQEEFERYKREVLRYWGTYEGTTRKKWVQYDENFKVKKVFDFEKGVLRVEVIGKANRSRIKGILEDFVSQDKRTAFRRDKLLSRIDKRVKRLKHVKSASVDREPVLAPILFGRSRVDKAHLKEGVEKLLRKGRLYTKRLKNGKRATVFEVKVPPKSVLRKARQYKPYVERESQRWKLSPALVFAIIHTESYFNPLATSPVPAYGLMQIVPKTAGRDASKLLFGRPVLLSPSYLYNAKNNIQVGTAYFYLLYYKYFKGVRDPESRLYCAIAAYNTGPGNVARAFTGTTKLKKAIRIINSLTPREVYNTLIRRLPYRETREYLKKVSSRIALYRNL